MEALPTIWKDLQSDTSVESIVFYSEKPGNFIAGADIAMLAKATSAEDAAGMARAGQSILSEIAASKKPVVAAINGSCMGLGTELTLACHWRIATDSPKTIMSLPEVQLGLLPGAGGTQRLPRLVGVPNALGMALTGKQVRAKQAKKMGLIDEVVAGLGPGLASPEENTMGYLRTVAINKAREIAASGGKVKRKPLGLVNRLLTFNSLFRPVALEMAARQVAKQTRGNYPAPTAILKCVTEGMTNGLSSGFAKEAKEFGRLSQTKESRALISIFFASQALKKNRFGKPKNECKTLGVLGAGLMGAGIADVSLNKAKLNVLLKDATEDGLARGEKQISDNLDKSVKRRIMTQLVKEQRLANLHGSITYKGFEKADLVIEAVPEDLAIKHAVIRDLEAITPNHCIIATNTSALPITDIAKGSARPENIVGMHYFSPVEKMPLLEVITHPGTSNEAAAQAVNIGIKQGKTVIVVADGPGFYTTRILMPFVAEAFALLSEGVSISKIDSVIKKYGFPVGPCALTDEVGLDVGLHIAKYLKTIWPERFAGKELVALEEFVLSGFSGRKSGKGFFLYDTPKPGLISRLMGKGGKQINPDAVKILAKHQNATEKEVSDETIFLRMVGRMANEAVMCLEEGILKNATDGDIGAVFGLGFPPFLGGPFRWIDQIGAVTLTRHLEGFSSRYGPQFKPSAMLVDLAKSGKKFHD